MSPSAHTRPLRQGKQEGKKEEGGGNAGEREGKGGIEGIKSGSLSAYTSTLPLSLGLPNQGGRKN